MRNVRVWLGLLVLTACSTDEQSNLAREQQSGTSSEQQASIPSEQQVDQPNILFVIADDYGVDQSRIYSESAAAPTPGLEQLAERGLVFEHAWSSPFCSPTRATLITGQYSFNNGLSWVLNDSFPGSLGLDDRLESEHFLPKRVGALGYDTGMIGKWHLSSTDMNDPIRAGFDFWTGTLGSFSHGLGAPEESVAAFWGTNLQTIRCEGDACEPLSFPRPEVGWPVPEEFHHNYRPTWAVNQAIDRISERESP